MEVDGYHGTTLDRANDIVAKGMRQSERKGLWLGIGRYFFQDGPSLALHWAKKEIVRQHLSDTPAVVHVRIDLSRCIDLTDNVYWPRVTRIHIRMQDQLSQQGIQQLGFGANLRDLSAEETRKLGYNRVDSLVMTAARESIAADYKDQFGIDITTVRGAFAEGKPVFPTSWMFDESNVTISVIDPEALRSPFRTLRLSL
jgi:hypothetical protein